MPKRETLIIIIFLVVITITVGISGCDDTTEQKDMIVDIEAPNDTFKPVEVSLTTDIPLIKFSPETHVLRPNRLSSFGIEKIRPTPQLTLFPTPHPTLYSTPIPIPTPTPEPMKEMNYVPGYTNKTFVNFRSEPSLSAEIIKICRYGTSVLVTGRSSEWFSVVIDDVRGFIARPYVTCGYLVTPAPVTPKPTQVPMYTVSPGQFTDYEISLVAALLHREGPGSTSKGYRAIASVVLNRVMNKSGKFPNDVAGVLFQRGQFGYSREELESVNPNPVAMKAAKYVFSTHGSVLPKKVLFYRAAYLGYTWTYYMRYYATIEGNCYFYGRYFY